MDGKCLDFSDLGQQRKKKCVKTTKEMIFNKKNKLKSRDYNTTYDWIDITSRDRLRPAHCKMCSPSVFVMDSQLLVSCSTNRWEKHKIKSNEELVQSYRVRSEHNPNDSFRIGSILNCQYPRKSCGILSVTVFICQFYSTRGNQTKCFKLNFLYVNIW